MKTPRYEKLTPAWVPPAWQIEEMRREQAEREAQRPRLELHLPVPTPKEGK